MSPVMFGLLGPVQISVGGMPHPIGGPHTRALLAALLLRANQVVTVERLVDVVWGDSPPGSARVQAQNRVAGLRKVLRPFGADVIETHGAGYLIRVEQGQLDTDLFSDQVDQARARVRQGDLAIGADLLRSALAIWRGPALDGTGTPLLAAAAERLEEVRVRVREELIDAEMALGRHESVIGELVELTAEHPWRERLTAQLMRALHRSNRQRDALAHYERIRRRLRNELGIDPGPELVRLRDDILRATPSSKVSPPVVDRTGQDDRSVVPRQLPARERSLIGRDKELHAIVATLQTSSEARARPVVVAIHGPAGVGKTALAVAAGHAISAQFPDGQLYVDLQGAMPANLAPLTPDDVVGRFLRALGVQPGRVPANPAEAAALYRTILARRRLVLIADNAGSHEQVTPLLPPAGGCAVILTSRRVLGMLDSDVRLDLGALSPDDATAMLANAVGKERVAAEPQMVAEVVRACGHLPLALKVAGARLVSRPDWSFADLSRRLGDEKRAMNELSTAEESVRSSLRVSWSELAGSRSTVDTLAATVFVKLGALRLPKVQRSLVVAVSEITARQAEIVLDRLVEARLLTVDGSWYRMHNVVRMFATELATLDPAIDRPRLLQLALARYTAIARQVNRLMRGPHASWASATGIGSDPADPDLTDAADAGSWLDTERSNLVALVRQALAEHQEDHLAGELVLSLYPAILMRGHGYEWEVLCRSVLDAADRMPDQGTVATVWTKLAVLYGLQHRFDDALDCSQRALSLHRAIGDRAGYASALEAAGMVQVRRGKAELAVTLYEQALRLRHKLGDRFAEGITRSNAAQAYQRLGRYGASLRHLERSLEIRRECGDLAGEAISLLNLGELNFELQRYDDAARFLDAAIECSRRAGERVNERRSLVLRARLRLGRGDVAAALRDSDAAVELARAAGGVIEPTEFIALIRELDAVGQLEYADRVRRRITG